MTAALKHVQSDGCQDDVSANRPHPLETVFMHWMIASGYEVEYEPRSFEIEPRAGHTEPQRPTPDIWIKRLPNGSDVSQGPVQLFIELCNADKYISPHQLSQRTLRHNLQHAKSGKTFISAVRYLKYKRARMRKVERAYPGVIIEVIDYATQNIFMTDPDLLLERLYERIEELALQPAITAALVHL